MFVFLMLIRQSRGFKTATDYTTQATAVPFLSLHSSGVRGSVVIRALRYKPEGLGFENRCGGYYI
jgi:hypothetical protein